MSERTKTDPDLVPPALRGFPTPWGLLLLLGLYVVFVLGYVWLQFWSSDEWAAARHVDNALELLGQDMGRTTPEPELIEAYEELLEAGRLQPHIRAIHDELEKLNWRFEERKIDQPEALRRHAEAVGILYQRAMQADENAPFFDTKPRGWDRRTLLAGPWTVFLWSIVGFVLIIVLWGYLRFAPRSAKALEKAQYSEELEREVKELGRFRRRRKD